MTWEQLAERIAQMTPDERQKQARFREPYCDEAEVYTVTVAVARENLYNPIERRIKRGDCYLEAE